MTSIDENGGYTADGKTTYGYIPANTGVLLKVLDQATTPDGFYYTIGEHDDATYTISNNLMHGITIQDTDIEGKELPCPPRLPETYLNSDRDSKTAHRHRQ